MFYLAFYSTSSAVSIVYKQIVANSSSRVYFAFWREDFCRDARMTNYNSHYLLMIWLL